MADLGHQLTDKELEQLEKRIAREYAQAAKDMRRKLRDYMEQFEEGKAKQKALLDAGKITLKEYKDWIYRHTMMGNQWRDMKNVLADDLKRANDIALRMSRDQMADIYALNANYAMFQIEHDFGIDTGFTLYNHDTAEYLLSEQRQLMPGPSARKAKEIAENKAMQWNRQKIQSAVLQGVLQGESPYEVAKRLMGVAQMGYNASVRYARTMTTSAQNAGRYNSYRRAKGLGVDLTIEWQATLDGRTRHEHRMMHGQRRDVDEPFEVDGVKILYPAQSDGPGSSDIPQSLIWNCRCTLLAWVKGFEGDTVKSSPKMGEMSFEEWQHAKEPKKKAVSLPAFNFGGVDETVASEYKRAISELNNVFPLRSKPIKSVSDFRTAWGISADTDLDDFVEAHPEWHGVGGIFYPTDTTYPGAKTLHGAHIVMYDAEDYSKTPLHEHLKALADLRDKNGWAGKQDSFFNLAIGIEGAVTHEYGHALANDCGLYMGQNHYGDLAAIFGKYTAEEIGKEISIYATSNPQEMFAEAFVAWQEPRLRTPIVNEIMNLVFSLRG